LNRKGAHLAGRLFFRLDLRLTYAIVIFQALTMATPQADIDLDTLSTPEAPSLFKVRELLPAPLRSTVHSGRKLLPENKASGEDPPLPTTIKAIDDLIAGGLPRGRLVELTGERSSGRFSALLAALAAVTRSGEAAVLVDLDDSLDPQGAVAAGIALERLLFRSWRSISVHRPCVVGEAPRLTGCDWPVPPMSNAQRSSSRAPTGSAAPRQLRY
jgi:hypothetical protein